MAKKNEKHIDDILDELSKKYNVEKKQYELMFKQIIAKIYEYNQNGVTVNMYPLGKFTIATHKARKVKGINGEINEVPEKKKLKFKTSEISQRIYENHEYYDYFEADLNNPYDFYIYITKNTPKIQQGYTHWDCLEQLANVLWKGYTVLEFENNEQAEEFQRKFDAFVSEEKRQALLDKEKELALEEKKKDNKKVTELRQELKEIRRNLKIIDALKQNQKSNRIIKIIK